MNHLSEVAQGVGDKIKYKEGWKTVCVSNVLAKLGINHNQYRYTSSKKNMLAYKNVIRKFGYSMRSRKSYLPKTVASAAKRLKDLDDPIDVKYVVLVRGHLLMLNRDGTVAVDTSPRKVDRRRIEEIHAVYRKKEN